MSIFERIQRIAKANINWLLDKAEPAESELESKIKELAGAIQEGRAAVSIYGATFRKIEKEAADISAQQADIYQRAEEAVKAGDEALARKLLSERLKISERLNNLTPGLEDGRKTYDRLRDNLVQLQDQLQQAKLKLAELKSRQRSAAARKAFGEQVDKTASLSDDGAMFDRMEDQVLQTEAEADVMEDIHGGDVDLIRASRELQVEAELDAIKDKLHDKESRHD